MSLASNIKTPALAAVQAAKYVVMEGGQSRPRGMPVLETLWVDFNVMNPEDVPFDIEGRKLNPRYSALEICSLLAGTPVDAHQRYTAKSFAPYQDYGIQRGNYGVRLRNQLRDFVYLLGIEDSQSRRAVMTIFDGSRDLGEESSDIPCTLAVQGMVRDGIFYMKTTMRSNDAFLGLPYDLTQFCVLQTTMSEILMTINGFYRHSVGSLHVYVQDIDKIEVMQEPTERRDTEDPLWNIPDQLSDPRDRLKYVVMFCQDALYGQAQKPQTDFEEWLVNSL